MYLHVYVCIHLFVHVHIYEHMRTYTYTYSNSHDDVDLASPHDWDLKTEQHYYTHSIKYVRMYIYNTQYKLVIGLNI